MKNNFTRGEGVLDQMLAKMRANKAKALLANARNKKRVLDIGCGSYPLFLITIDYQEKFGVDPMLTINSFDGIKLKKANVENDFLPFDKNYFDAVSMLAVFEHINQNKLSHVLKESYRVLSEGGFFVITTPSPWSDKLLHFMARAHLISAEEIHEHKHNHTRHYIMDMLTKSGFDKKKIKSGYFELGFNMYFVAQK